MVKRLQTALRIAGYRLGAVDGKLGRNTLHAMQLYQGEQGLASGALTLETLQHLGLLEGHDTSK
jgi:peptidoglycan hydrolase-like protein with peptidoglycan-binding domain